MSLHSQPPHLPLPLPQNDLGLKKGDDAAMMANLAAQGITTVVSISSNGAVDSPPATEATGKADESPRGNRRAAGGKTTLVLG